MKVKELIRLLQEEDPTGETEVCVDNIDIFSVHTEPAYWDGKLQLLIRDDSKKPYYDVVGAKYVTKGCKIVLHPMSVSDVLWDNPDAEVDYSELHPSSVASYKEQDDKTRQRSRDVELKVEMDGFYRWVKKKVDAVRPGEECRYVADSFYKENLSPKDPVKDLPPKPDKDGNLWHPSWAERREAYWDDLLEVYWEGGWEIRKRDAQAD